jgi:hypothetical protein
VKPRRQEIVCGELKPDGTRCQAYGRPCAYHRRTDAGRREMAKAGGEARRKGLAERLPEAEARSLRDTLREGLDPAAVLAAAQRALTGENEAARVSVIKFLADLEIYKRDEPKLPESRAPVTRHEPAELLRKLWEIGCIACPTCDGPLVKSAELDGVVPHFGQSPVVRTELLDAESEAT